MTNNKKKPNQIWIPSEKNFLDPRMFRFKRPVLQITYEQKLVNDATIVNLLCMYIVDLSVFKCLVFCVSKYLVRDCGFA